MLLLEEPFLMSIAVVEKDLHALPYANIAAVQGLASAVDTSRNTVVLTDGSSIPYDKLCICTGAIPKVSCPA